MSAPELAIGKKAVEGEGSSRLLRRILILFAAIVALIGFISMAGWATNNLMIDSILSSYVPITLSVSMFITVLSFGLLVSAGTQERPFLRGSALVGAATILVFCVWILLPISPISRNSSTRSA